MTHTIIGMFDTAAAATAAKQKLTAAGIATSAIKTLPSGNVSASSGTTTQAVPAADEHGFWSSVKEMFGGEEDAEYTTHTSHYAEGARRGGVVLSVEAEEKDADRVADLLTAAGAVNVDEKATEWAATGYKAPAAAVTTAAATSTAATTARAGATAATSGKIDLVKEDLAVGKRVVNRGGVRIIKKVISRPVEEDVKLREEHVSVDRRTVDRAVTGTDLTDAFKEGTIEMTESGEEVVASKTARVVGEVVLGKTVDERTEKVRDTLRETDVQVEQLPGTAVSTSTTKTVEDATGTKSTSKTNV